MTFMRTATESPAHRDSLRISATVPKARSNRTGHIAVGTDGSYWGQAALGWAARYALTRGAELDVYEADRRFEQLPPDLPADIGTGSILRPYPLLAARVRGSGADSTGALLAAGAESELVVVGCRGQRRRNLGLGSHALVLVANADCDVVVVRGRPQAVRGEFGKVIAWVDGDERIVSGPRNSPAASVVRWTSCATSPAATRRTERISLWWPRMPGSIRRLEPHCTTRRVQCWWLPEQCS